MAIPSWLDPSTEIKTPTKPEWFDKLTRPYSDAVFYLWAMSALNEAANKLGYPPLIVNQLTEITANFSSETLHGEKWNANNWGGVKIYKPYVNSYKLEHGKSPSWFQSKGHEKSGDEAIVYYVGFDSVEQLAEFWLTRYVPFSYAEMTEEAAKKERYFKTAKAFWEERQETSTSHHWFYELCVSGYKGPVTQKNPTPSVNSLFEIKKRIKTMVCQLLLELTTDNSWGAKSTEKAKTYQQESNLALTDGSCSDELFEALVERYFSDSEFARKFGFKF
jgi:hypothetical protein